uniref:40S ribosomal protein S27 n=1 Tax=Poecilia mexicana TaxID=48701 RepID=A0A3B3XFN8_9TELE
MPLAKDLLYPSLADERRKHKKKRLVQNPNSYFMDVKCIGCYRISTIFSHAHTVVACPGCSVILCRPRGGKCRLTAGGCSVKPHLVYMTLICAKYNRNQMPCYNKIRKTFERVCSKSIHTT